MHDAFSAMPMVRSGYLIQHAGDVVVCTGSAGNDVIRHMVTIREFNSEAIERGIKAGIEALNAHRADPYEEGLARRSMERAFREGFPSAGELQELVRALGD